MRFIDVHCHLDGGHYGDIGSLLDRLAALGVEKVISAGVDISTGRFCRDIAEKYPQVYFTAGFHPTELDSFKEEDLKEIEELARHPKCVAIGEIGLDYHYPDTDKPLQQKVFLKQLELAAKLNMPVEIHSRDCAEDMLELLNKNDYIFGSGALLHCYSHSTEIALELQKKGAYFSFGGTSTYSGSKKARRTIKALQETRLLTETDSPYLPPESKRGIFPNTPESIPEIAENMAELRETAQETMYERIWANAHTLFKKL